MENSRFKFRFWNNLSKQYENTYDLKSCEVLDYVIPEQCTGLKDKNGKLIYENDIFKIDNDIWCIFVDAYGLWTACYNGNPIRGCMEWVYFVKNYIIDRETSLLEVIGNINQNADLLENEE